MKKHYPISPSATGRILKCPGSIELSKDCVRIESSHAAEGTVAHDVAESVASLDVVPEGTNEEMTEAAKKWKTTIEWVEKDHLIIDRWFERTLESKTNPDFGGTPDYHAVTPDTIIIGDFKYGKGVKVNAKNNTQLMSYLLLARELHLRASNFVAFILQPRLNHFDLVEFEGHQLDDFQSLLHKTAVRDDVLTGNHCKWCPAMTKCPRLWKEVLDLFSDESGDSIVPSLDKQLELLPRLKELVDRIPQEAAEVMKQGRALDGYKLVQRLGRRSFSVDEKTIRDKFDSLDIPSEKYTKTSLLSPTQMEKAGLGDIISEYVSTPERGLTVAPCDDPRQQVKPGENDA